MSPGREDERRRHQILQNVALMVHCVMINLVIQFISRETREKADAKVTLTNHHLIFGLHWINPICMIIIEAF